MASNDVDICNLALDHLGKPAITSLTEGSTSAKHCLRQYDTARRMCLARNPWTFSRKLRALSALTDNPLPDLWSSHYDLPNDMLHLLRVLPAGVQPQENSPPLARYIESGTIYTNLPDAYLWYTWDNEDVSTWTALFTDVVALFLAMRLAPQMIRRKSDVTMYQDMYRSALGEAVEQDSAQEPQTYTFHDGGYVDARDQRSTVGARQLDGSTIWE